MQKKIFFIFISFLLCTACVTVPYREGSAVPDSAKLRNVINIRGAKELAKLAPPPDLSTRSAESPCEEDRFNRILKLGYEFGSLYSYCNSYYDYQLLKKYPSDFGQVERYRLASTFGSIWIDYYRNPTLKNRSVILIFPVLGGNYHIEHFFANALNHRYDTAIVHRNNEFKDPRNFSNLEQIFRESIIKDRIALDFFQRELEIVNFGTFGISRGAINVASTAAVDERLQRNVLVLGGSDLSSIIAESDQKGLARFVDKVVKHHNKSKKWVVDEVKKKIFTEPKHLAPFLEPKNTLLILGIFDSTVPFANGLTLRELAGKPETIYLLSDHYLGLLYTQIAQFILPFGLTIFPCDYVESMSLDFYDQGFGDGGFNIYRILTAPLNYIFRLFL